MWLAFTPSEEARSTSSSDDQAPNVRKSRFGSVIRAEGMKMLDRLSDRALFGLALLFAGLFTAMIDLVMVLLNGSAN
jgi:hypothetical protein